MVDMMMMMMLMTMLMMIGYDGIRNHYRIQGHSQYRV